MEVHNNFKESLVKLTGIPVIVIMFLGLIIAQLKMKNYDKRAETNEENIETNNQQNQSYYDHYKKDLQNHFAGAQSSL